MARVRVAQRRSQAAARSSADEPAQTVFRFGEVEVDLAQRRVLRACLVELAARAARLASLIPNYPATAYLSYFQIKPRLFTGAGHANLDAPDAPVLSFLQRNCSRDGATYWLRRDADSGRDPDLAVRRGRRDRPGRQEWRAVPAGRGVGRLPHPPPRSRCRPRRRLRRRAGGKRVGGGR